MIPLLDLQTGCRFHEGEVMNSFNACFLPRSHFDCIMHPVLSSELPNRQYGELTDVYNTLGITSGRGKGFFFFFFKLVGKKKNKN